MPFEIAWGSSHPSSIVVPLTGFRFVICSVCVCVCVCVCLCVCELLSCIQLYATLWVVSRQASLSMGFFRQEYWSGLPFPSSGALPSPGIKPGCPALQADSLPSGPSEITKSFGLLQRSYLISINMHLSSVFWLLTLIAAPGTWKTPWSPKWSHILDWKTKKTASKWAVSYIKEP